LDTTLAAVSPQPVLIAMHHPPFETGIWWMDAMGLEGAAGLADVLDRHRHVGKVVCGHIHRSITTTVGHASVTVTPSTGQQVRLDLDGAGAGLTDEQPQIGIHHWTGSAWISHHTAFQIGRDV